VQLPQSSLGVGGGGGGDVFYLKKSVETHPSGED
jgi:hypothetical protein